jgi:hypothetical protein
MANVFASANIARLRVFEHIIQHSPYHPEPRSRRKISQLVEHLGAGMTLGEIAHNGRDDRRTTVTPRPLSRRRYAFPIPPSATSRMRDPSCRTRRKVDCLKQSTFRLRLAAHPIRPVCFLTVEEIRRYARDDSGRGSAARGGQSAGARLACQFAVRNFQTRDPVGRAAENLTA